MNIKRAKQEITNTIKAYLARDAFGEYQIPPVRQRPILLMGPPGIGKTQIMEQIAAEIAVWVWSPIRLPIILARAHSACPLSSIAPTTDRNMRSRPTP